MQKVHIHTLYMRCMYMQELHKRYIAHCSEPLVSSRHERFFTKNSHFNHFLAFLPLLATLPNFPKTLQLGGDAQQPCIARQGNTLASQKRQLTSIARPEIQERQAKACANFRAKFYKKVTKAHCSERDIPLPFFFSNHLTLPARRGGPRLQNPNILLASDFSHRIAP